MNKRNQAPAGQIPVVEPPVNSHKLILQRRESESARCLHLANLAMLPKPAPEASDYGSVTRSADQSGPSRRRGSLDVLIVEGDPNLCALIAKCLEARGREHIQIRFAHTIKEARAVIRGQKHNCVLVGHELPDGYGIDLIEELGEELLTTPVIGFAPDLQTTDPIEYFRAGCVDFFVIDEILDADNLRRAIAQTMARFHRRAMGTIIERRELGDAVNKSQEGLIALARTDRLMGICNRAVFDDYFMTHHAEAVGRQGKYALCMIDVDNFKKYNDRYGHTAGDDVLRRVGQVLAATLRENDFIARYGGEEIVVLLDEVDAEDARHIGNRLRKLIHALNITHKGNEPHERVTVSTGIAAFGADQAQSPAEVLDRADGALYQAKANGRNTVVVAGSDRIERRLSA